MSTQYLLVYADGRSQILDYIPIMGEGDILLERKKTELFGSWSINRQNKTINRQNK